MEAVAGYQPIAPATLKGWTYGIKGFEDKPVEEVDKKFVNLRRSQLNRSGYKPSYVRTLLGYCGTIWQIGYEQMEIVDGNPWRAPTLQMDGVPANETALTLTQHIANLLGVEIREVSLRRANDTCILPGTTLSLLAVDGMVHLKIIPNILVGGDRAPSRPYQPLAEFAFCQEPTTQPQMSEPATSPSASTSACASASTSACASASTSASAFSSTSTSTSASMSTSDSTCRQAEMLPHIDPPIYPPHEGRRRVVQQPPQYYPNIKREGLRWACFAEYEEKRTGNADRPDLWVFTRSNRLQGATEQEVLRKREEYLRDVLHPKPRAAKTGKRFAPTEERAPREGKRRVVPESFGEPKLQSSGPSSEQARAGPGRGRTFEPAADAGSSSSAPLEEPVEILATKSSNWLDQASMRVL